MTMFDVEVRGSWRDLSTHTEAPRTQRFRVLAPSRMSAEVTGAQLFGAAAAGERCAVGACSARIAPPAAVDGG